jgi:hypothetical protein
MSPNVSQTCRRVTQSELLALAGSSSLLVGFFYQVPDASGWRWYMARTASSVEEIAQVPDFIRSVSTAGGVPMNVDANGQLSATIAPSVDANNAIVLGTDGKPYVATAAAAYITSKANTSTVSLDVTAAGELTASGILSVDAGNALTDQNGFFVKKLTVAAGSAEFAEITAANELIVKSQRLTDFQDAPAYNSVADFVAALNSGAWTPEPGKTLRKMDFVALSGSGGNYIYRGPDAPTAVTAEMFQAIEGGEYTTDNIRAMFSGTGSINFNPASGVISFVTSSDAGNDLVFGTDGKAFVSVENSVVPTTDETGAAQSLSTKATFDDIYALIAAGTTGADNGVTKNGAIVELGGTLTKDTTIAQSSKKLIVSGGNFQIDSALTVPVMNLDASDNPTTPTGSYSRIWVGADNNLYWTTFPN